MTDQYPTLRTIFNVNDDVATQGIIAAVDASVWESVGIPQRLRAKAARKIAKTLDAFLSTSLQGVVRGALETYGVLAKYADGEDHEVDNCAFSIESEHEPHVDLRMSGLPPQPVTFPLSVSMQFSRVRLVISRNRVMAMKTGRCVVAGTLYCEDVELFSRPASPFKLRAEFAFAEGIPILGSSHRA